MKLIALSLNRPLMLSLITPAQRILAMVISIIAMQKVSVSNLKASIQRHFVSFSRVTYNAPGLLITNNYY